MNEVKRYECSICKSIYSDMNKAAKCEREHKTGLKLVDTEYESVFIRGLNFPRFVKLQAPDGKSMYYKADI
uniref:Kruppel-like factor 3 finger, kruppel-like, DNA BINDING n=1 Tax=Siphoviridae sp. ct5d86 TaxID=2827561 RepID=A0A8S5LMA8_9CAUD|nr:MAG TPA: Kruppel-like factor 3 finger, kruppel-like, DNA BINDING [Siphoviridae sp. ct5d86]DAO25326.1 MAG TPA: Kruppel-like factor 3 finger, kruppel-like, DNA BINDING [Caudoviricetes sp.]